MSDTALFRDKSTWQALFDEISQGREGESVTIEVLDEDLGDQTQAERMPFRSVSYDKTGDVVVVAVGGTSSRWPVVLRHLIHGPESVDVLERADSGLVLRFVDRGGVVTLLVFRP